MDFWKENGEKAKNDVYVSMHVYEKGKRDDCVGKIDGVTLER